MFFIDIVKFIRFQCQFSAVVIFYTHFDENKDIFSNFWTRQNFNRHKNHSPKKWYENVYAVLFGLAWNSNNAKWARKKRGKIISMVQSHFASAEFCICCCCCLAQISLLSMRLCHINNKTFFSGSFGYFVVVTVAVVVVAIKSFCYYVHIHWRRDWCSVRTRLMRFLERESTNYRTQTRIEHHWAVYFIVQRTDFLKNCWMYKYEK